MDIFPEGAPQESGARLVREAMAEAAEGAPPLPDLVPVALAEGRRRRTRARAAIGGTAAGVVVLGVLGATLPSWGTGTGTGGGAAQVGASAVPSMGHGTPSPTLTTPATGFPPPPSFTEPPRKPVHVEPTTGESSMADLPAAERARQEEFQQKAAVVLDELLPAAFGTVRPVDLAVSRYQGGSGGRVFPVVFSVRPTGDEPGSPTQEPCWYGPEKTYRCEKAALPGGITARTVTAVGSSKGGKSIVGVSVRFTFKDSTVVLSADGDDSAVVSAPVTVDQLLHVARDQRFLRLVRYAEAFPMEPGRESVHGG
ncbi:hypothetical protein GCM10015535_54000 [Streptomyces gelaticus]|uniref:Tat pathway signal sequence domain protein n=1 Tax=Streptomyces gelaticus TaxID=285446 RepID=A0ABQ2W5R6_9ACTN|nr:hypothetical protein [Streptomyces gelaticus]GGV92624.1 hypothetical protein GCM10015535_54000 [Streptomyces gelaticus]